MANILENYDIDYHGDQNSNINQRSSSFLCCFGFSRKPLSEKIKSPKKISQSHNNNHYSIKKIVTFSWLRFRKKNPAGIKTVPVLDSSTVPEKPQSVTKFYSSKPKSKSTTPPPSEIEIVVTAPPDPTPKEKPNQIRYGAATQNTNLENRNISVSGPLQSSKDDTCQKRLSFTRKIDAIRTGSSQPGSPVNLKSKPGPTNPVVTRQFADVSTAPTRDKTRFAPTKPGVTARRFEPVVGLSVVMVTLVIMVLWGRICAILCTSAWLYFVPRLITTVESNGSGSGDLDLGSEESKKKVVFEGFLERNHRSS